MTKLDEKTRSKPIFGFKPRSDASAGQSMPAAHSQQRVYSPTSAKDELRTISAEHYAQEYKKKSALNHLSLVIKLVALAVIISSLSFILPQYSLLRCLSILF